MIKDDTVFLRHILDAINKIQEYTKGMDYEGFRASSLVQDGVRLLRQKAERQIEKMCGERNFDKRRKEI